MPAPIYMPKQNNMFQQMVSGMMQNMMQNNMLQKLEIEKRKTAHQATLEDEQRKRTEWDRQQAAKTKQGLLDKGYEPVAPNMVGYYKNLGVPIQQVGNEILVNKQPPLSELEKTNVGILAAEKKVDYAEQARLSRPEKSPTTAMGAYLQKKPNATVDEISKFARSLKTEKAPPQGSIAQYNLARLQGYKGGFTAWKKELAKSGAANINITQERFGLQKKVTAATARESLVRNKDDKNAYESNVEIFNTTNARNEVSYWDKGDGRFYDEESKIIKLTPAAMRMGWTPKKVQERADAKGITVQQQLKDIGLLE